MYCLSLKEVITYYKNKGSTVYACFIDASKAFDHVRHDRLFQLLGQRGLPLIALRLLIDMYRRQSSRTMWDNCYSEYFGAANGLQIEHIISTNIHFLYRNDLLQTL